MPWRRCRRFAAGYFAFFFFAVAAAPHIHINGLEDLLLDQPSDSGVIFQPVSQPASGQPIVVPVRDIRDVPCPACFTRDFVSTFAVTIAFVPRLTPLPASPNLPSRARPELVPTDASSRAPPADL
jgi:hypothetical protein